MNHVLLIAMLMVSSLVTTAAIGVTNQAAAEEFRSSATALIARVLPDHASHFICEVIPPTPDGKDQFEIESRDGRVVLRGNNGVSLAMAFNWYLRYDALTSYDWQATGPLRIKGSLPLPSKKVQQSCLARERFFLNYCTYGYTFPFTDYAGWERFFDWMAMNGINRPLMTAGQEAVWLKVWMSYGLSQEDVRAYFTGPAYLPWHRMSNIDRFDGPLPMSYITGQMELQKRLLARARSLGMEPILSGYAGHVPAALRAAKPNAKIEQIRGGWGGFKAADACWFLDPLDPLFGEIQAKFLSVQTDLYGTNHRYAADPFNEIHPPSWEPAYMADVARGIYASMNAVDPQAVWYQMSWTFYQERRKWGKKSPDGETPLHAMLDAVPRDRLVLLDYVCEELECYRQFDGFHGTSFIWNVVGNYGGNTYLRAPLTELAKRIEMALNVPNCVGVGGTLEGINCNPVTFEMILEQPWHAGGVIDPRNWIADYAARRAGGRDSHVIKAWKLLLDEVLDPGPQGHFDRGSAVTAAPPRWAEPGGAPPPKAALSGDVPERDPRLTRGLVAALEELFLADPDSKTADGYRYDVVNLMRQALAYYSDTVKSRMQVAHQRNDQAEVARQCKVMLDILRDMDELTATRHEFLLGPWIRDARAWGTTPQEADYYESDARRIITEWGGGLRDYARREWNGLIRDYYYPRWWQWAKKNAPDAVKGEPDLGPKVDFVRLKDSDYAVKPVGDPEKTSRRLLLKYKDAMSR